MNSRIAQALKPRYELVAIVWTDEKPTPAVQFAAGRWGCVMCAFMATAEQGRVAVFDHETYGCWGGGVGLGFGNVYEKFPGGLEGFCNFLSTGNAQSERGRAIADACAGWMKGQMREEFLHGERYRKNPEAVKGFVEHMPLMDVPARYVVFKPLSQVQPDEKPQVVVFLANADQMSALVVLANYRRGDSDGAIIPHAAGCQTIGIFAYQENQRQQPRAVVGLNDLSARKYMRKLGKDLVTVAVPWKLFVQMEEDVPGSFLEKEPWLSLSAEGTVPQEKTG